MIFRIFGSSDTSCYITFQIQLAFVVWIKTDLSQTRIVRNPVSEQASYSFEIRLTQWVVSVLGYVECYNNISEEICLSNEKLVTNGNTSEHDCM